MNRDGCRENDTLIYSWTLYTLNEKHCPSVLLLDIFSRTALTSMHLETCIRMVTALLFGIVKKKGGGENMVHKGNNLNIHLKENG